MQCIPDQSHVAIGNQAATGQSAMVEITDSLADLQREIDRRGPALP